MSLFTLYASSKSHCNNNTCATGEREKKSPYLPGAHTCKEALAATVGASSIYVASSARSNTHVCGYTIASLLFFATCTFSQFTMRCYALSQQLQPPVYTAMCNTFCLWQKFAWMSHLQVHTHGMSYTFVYCPGTYKCSKDIF